MTRNTGNGRGYGTMSDAMKLPRLLLAEGQAHLDGNVRDHRTVGALLVSGGHYIEALQAENAKLKKALSLYSCEDGCNDCPEHERDKAGCGWTAFTALQEAKK